MLNKHPLTISDTRNDESRMHTDHKVKLIGREILEKDRVPYRFLRISKFFCYDCKKMYSEFNWEDDEDVKKKVSPTHFE